MQYVFGESCCITLLWHLTFIDLDTQPQSQQVISCSLLRSHNISKAVCKNIIYFIRTNTILYQTTEGCHFKNFILLKSIFSPFLFLSPFLLFFCKVYVESSGDQLLYLCLYQHSYCEIIQFIMGFSCFSQQTALQLSTWVKINFMFGSVGVYFAVITECVRRSRLLAVP